MAGKKDDHIKHGDGFADITLSRPLDVNGAKISTVRMREPTVADQMASEKASDSEAEKELTLMGNLSELTVDDLKRLTLRDYVRMRTALLGFVD